ncbi:MAG TPA: hypothetical protein VNN08_13165 [Thermoanaerobaculia bacterium]|nr:hypothetical protein [Thermoanaerobaculia bacterium]
MKPIVLSSCLALASLSLYAADPQTPKDSPPPQSTHVQTLLSAQTSGTGDSPLVRAAKATNRLGKKPTQVITNETLVREGGHFTTTTPEAQAQLPSMSKPAGPSADQIAADARRARAEAAAAADKLKKNEEKKRIAAGRTAAQAEGDTPEGLYTDPPALEGPMTTIKPSTPETMGQQKPPK